MPITKTTAARRVARGVALLDERLPGWREEVQPFGFDIRNPCGCVVGKVFGEYWRGVALLGFTERKQITHGFQAETDKDFDLLQEAWLKALSNGETR